jgi:phosphohistidine phosphatase SixA
MRRAVWILLLTAAGVASAEPEQIVLVRHAERSAEPTADPALSPAGMARAQALAASLANAGVSAIITTQYRRSRETAQPLAESMHIAPQIVAARKGEGAAHVTEVAAAVRAQVGGTVLVVGHSNTVIAIAAALGAPKLADLCETSYSHVLVLRPAKPVPQLLHLRYGAPDTAPAEPDCQ